MTSSIRDGDDHIHGGPADPWKTIENRQNSTHQGGVLLDQFSTSFGHFSTPIWTPRKVIKKWSKSRSKLTPKKVGTKTRFFDFLRPWAGLAILFLGISTVT